MSDTQHPETQAARELPRYRCHKEVWALKILDIENRPHEAGAWIKPMDEGYGAFHVDDAYIIKHGPEVGGYYVVYKDGYTSYSPAQAFEEGYTRV
jgi:hypothetical protein